MRDLAYSMGRRLRQERLVAGKTQEELARALGIDRRRIEGFESGEERISPSHLARMCLVLGVPLSWLAFQSDDRLSLSDSEISNRALRFEVPRPTQVLSALQYAPAEGLLRAWRDNRGVITNDILTSIAAEKLVERAIVMRRSRGSAYFRFEYVSTKVPLAPPCEMLALVGREPSALPDSQYGEWMANVYARTAASGSPHVASILADVKTPNMDTRLIRTQHDRIVLPWKSRGGDTYVVGVSLLRRREVIAWAENELCAASKSEQAGWQAKR
jgi:transcriptional regulator with XRE-family HTH domain